MEHFWKKSILTAMGVLVSSVLAWMVIYPCVIVPQLGSGHSITQLASLLLVGLALTFIVLGATIRSAREFWIMSVISGFLLQIVETFSAIAFPYAPQTPDPLQHWTVDLLFAIVFSAFLILIGLPFGWLFRRFQKPDLQ